MKQRPRSTRLASRARCLIAVVLLIATAGCSPNPPPPTTPAPPSPIQRWGGLLTDTREVWTAENGIDLLTGPAVLIRAYRESIDLAQSMGSFDYLYTGFARAVPPNKPNDPVMASWDRWPTTELPDTKPIVGTWTSHILSVTRSSRDVTAVVCSYTYAAATETAPGKYASRGGGPWLPNPGVNAYRVELSAPELETGAPLPPQKGPEPAPVTDVFGGWTIIGSLNTYAYNTVDLAREWPTFESDLASCVAKAPDPPERRRFLVTGEHPRSDFPTAPATPGWPAESR